MANDVERNKQMIWLKINESTQRDKEDGGDGHTHTNFIQFVMAAIISEFCSSNKHCLSDGFTSLTSYY